MMRCGAECFGVVRCCVVWCGVVWCGVMGCDVVWCSVVLCGVVEYEEPEPQAAFLRTGV